MTATALQGMKTETAIATEETGILTESEREENDMEAEAGGAEAVIVMTDVSPLERDTVAITGTMMTIRGVLTMKMITGVGIFVAHAKTITAASDAEVGGPLEMTAENGVGGAGENMVGMA
jgi:hypothetical protein